MDDGSRFFVDRWLCGEGVEVEEGYMMAIYMPVVTR